MADSYPYKELYDRLRAAGYHEREDGSSHLAPYIPWLKDKLEFQTVLDIGCSAGGSLVLFEAEDKQAFGVDVSAAAVSKGKALGRKVVEASATSLPFPDDHFDLVTSADVFEHLHESDAEAAAKEAIRVAKHYIFMKIAEQEDVSKKWKDIAGHPLHLTLRPIRWWTKFFEPAGKLIRCERYVFCLELNKRCDTVARLN